MKYTEEQFYNEILYEQTIQNKTIDFGNEHIEIISFTGDVIELINCEIIASSILFKEITNSNLSISFNNCYINCGLSFENCQFENLQFNNTKALKSLYLRKTNKESFNLDRFNFINEKEFDAVLETEFYFRECNFESEFLLQNINHKKGKFIIESNSIGSEKFDNRIYNRFSINNSTLNNVCFHKNTFYSPFSIIKCTINYNETERIKYNQTTFSLNNFNKIAFNGTTFNGDTLFIQCLFNDVTYFNNINIITNKSFNFSHCSFKQYTAFSNSLVWNFKIENSLFNSTASFQGAMYKSIQIDKTNFEKKAYFDEIQIENPIRCNRETLRTIKQELQKADNKIDYNRFRAYELSAYYQELKWFRNFMDKSILGLTILFTGYNHNWLRAFAVTILTGMLFYSVLYYVEFYVFLSPENQNNFTSGAFRFFLVTDFFSPFLERKYLSNGLSWSVFVLGKIFIAFGIYEMIQAFRKFKA